MTLRKILDGAMLLALAGVVLATVAPNAHAKQNYALRAAAPAMRMQRRRRFDATDDLEGTPFTRPTARPLVSYRARKASRTRPAPIPNWPLVNAQAASVDYWGQPCGGNVAIDYSSTVPTGVVAGAMAWTWFQTPDGAMDFSESPSTYTDCTITLNTNWFAPSDQRSDFPLFCATMVREYAHLWGYGDDYSEPHTSILYPIITGANEAVPSCVAEYPSMGWPTRDTPTATWG